MMKGEDVMGNIEVLPLMVGFVAAFLAGCVACKWMINIVKRGKLIYFGIYCAIVGVMSLFTSLFFLVLSKHRECDSCEYISDWNRY